MGLREADPRQASLKIPRDLRTRELSLRSQRERARPVSILIFEIAFKLTYHAIEKSKKDEKKEEEPEGIKPTRAITSYIFFSNEMVPKIKKDEGVDHKTAMSRAGAMWGKLSDAEKQKYDKMHEDDQKR